MDDYGMVSFTPMDISDEDRCDKSTLQVCSLKSDLSEQTHESFRYACNSSNSQPIRLVWYSIAAALLQVDTAIQYGEDQEVATKDFGDAG